MILLIEEPEWCNSNLSVARHYGGVSFQGNEYNIVNKYGQTLFDSSIPPGEPADLVVSWLIPYYKKMGRDKFIQHLKTLSEGAEKKDVIKSFKEVTKRSKKPKNTELNELQLMFE